MNPFNSPTEVYIIQLSVGKIFERRRRRLRRVRVVVDAAGANTLPAMAKAGANYMNSQLIKMEAIVNGYVEGIALDAAALSAKVRGRIFSWCTTTS